MVPACLGDWVIIPKPNSPSTASTKLPLEGEDQSQPTGIIKENSPKPFFGKVITSWLQQCMPSFDIQEDGKNSQPGIVDELEWWKLCT